MLKAHAPLPVFIFMNPPPALSLVRLLCAGSLADLFSQRPCSRTEQHEPHAGSFQVRRYSHLPLCGEILSSQAHVSTQSAILKRGSHLPGFSTLTCDAVS